MTLMELLPLADGLLPERKSFDPDPQGSTLLGYLAWTVTAAAVGGIMVVGIQMALQLRRGEMGEGATYFRGLAIVVGACVLGLTAGPLVEFVIKPYVLAPP
ncbi:hypothetical protein [Streptomyces sp. DSM 40484]|jgi:hypothetical protein|uniref:hypothetical protein n=1 Tax=Streptomyces kroppenstedtii TaxID=3051181 RepID=UPI0028D4716E|nr:hypothetical protein [Streptomyces sp. DSM 40484]